MLFDRIFPLTALRRSERSLESPIGAAAPHCGLAAAIRPFDFPVGLHDAAARSEWAREWSPCFLGVGAPPAAGGVALGVRGGCGGDRDVMSGVRGAL